MRIPQAGTPSRRPSLRDVAKSAGVSAAAVSYVVTGRTKEVSASTLGKIERAIEELKYRPQRRGLSLKLNREFAIGLVVVDPSPNFLADPFTTEMAAGLSNALMDPGFGLTVTGCGSLADLKRLIGRPIGVDGFAIFGSGTPALRAQLYHAICGIGLPLVVVQDDAPPDIEDACSIIQDDFSGAQFLASHLVERGARRILFVKPSHAWPAIERRELGIRSALPESCTLVTIDCDERDFAATAAAIDRYIADHPLPDAIMGANDQIAVAALRILEQRGFSVPRDLQVTGYNDFPFRDFVRPLLTTVRSAAGDIGRSCAAAILARLDRGIFEERTVVHGVTLDVGSTTLPS